MYLQEIYQSSNKEMFAISLSSLCAMKFNPSAAWCNALESYGIACNSRGVNIDWEGKVDFGECGKDCVKLQSVLV
jgi:hypothetical protein